MRAEQVQLSQSLVGAVGRSYFPIALMARMPYAMMVVGVLALVATARDSLALAGLNSALVGVGAATVGPFVGAAADRWGQRLTLLLCSALSAASLATMAWVVYSPLPAVAVLGVAFCVGAFAPQVSPMSRSRLALIVAERVVPGRRARVFNSTMAYESAADETTFIVGPVVVGLLGTFLDPWAPLAGAAVITAVFATAFALHPSATPARDRTVPESAPAPARTLAHPGLLTIVAGMFGIGLFFGATLTSLTAFMGDHGGEERAGLVYGLMGLGSAALAMGVAWFSPRFSLRARWLVFATVLVAGTALLPFVTSVLAMSLVLLVIGLGIGPTMVTQYSLGSMRSPHGRAATLMTILGSAVVVGQSSASALTGLVADHAGAGRALWLPLVAALLVLASGVGADAPAAVERGDRGDVVAVECEIGSGEVRRDP